MAVDGSLKWEKPEVRKVAKCHFRSFCSQKNNITEYCWRYTTTANEISKRTRGRRRKFYERGKNGWSSGWWHRWRLCKREWEIYATLLPQRRRENLCVWLHVYSIHVDAMRYIYILCIISVRHSFLCGPFRAQQKASKQHFTHLLNHINWQIT